MAPGPLSNGFPNDMPLTEYSANPVDGPSATTLASAAVPEAFLLPDGHPDARYRGSLVCKPR